MEIRGFLTVSLAIASIAPATAGDVLYQRRDGVLFDGAYGPIARLQKKIDETLRACGNGAHVVADGKFGRGTAQGIAALAQCSNVPETVRNDVDVRRGAATTTLWQAVMDEPVPSVDARARTLMLTYEATDYTRMEWNFCQSSPLYDPTNGRNVCYSNDPKSYLTWGPNGATGGGGREVQLILQSVDQATPALLDSSFGSEAASVRRMFVLRDRDDNRTLETYLCGVWADRERRNAWKRGFASIGAQAAVREKFDDLYRSRSLDGGKITTFFTAYRDNGVVPSEVDYGFFKDRSAHTSPSLAPIKTAIANLLRSEPGAPNWKVRQAIALAVRPSSQSTDRLGRDIAFYLDGAGLEQLSREEASAWSSRGRFRASDVGLSDERPFGSFTPGPAIDTAIRHPDSLRPEERAACPQAVLDTRRP